MGQNKVNNSLGNALTSLISAQLPSIVPGIGCYLGLIDGGYGVIEEIKTP